MAHGQELHDHDRGLSNDLPTLLSRRRALTLLIRHAREIGLKSLRCSVLEGNTHAEKLYKDTGFRETGADDAGGRRFVQLALDL